MLLTITLGIILGVLGTALVRQWLSGALAQPARPALPAAEFPRLAPPARPTILRRNAA